MPTNQDYHSYEYLVVIDYKSLIGSSKYLFKNIEEVQEFFKSKNLTNPKTGKLCKYKDEVMVYQIRLLDNDYVMSDKDRRDRIENGW